MLFDSMTAALQHLFMTAGRYLTAAQQHSKTAARHHDVTA